MHYILKGHKAVEIKVWNGRIMNEAALIKWAMWFETANRHVAYTKLKTGEVSTIFLGIDAAFSINKRPLLFETMILGIPKLAGYQRRYTTWAEAVRGHKEALAEIARLDK